MARKFRSRITYANVFSTLCLFMLLGGAAYAASSFVGADGQIHGCVGKKGQLAVLKQGGHCQKGKSQLAWNQRGPRGVHGAKGDPGPVKGVLPSGVSEKGAFVARDTVGQYATVETAISFPLTLSAGVPAFYVAIGGSAVPQCTGSAANPTAARGSLCVYESTEQNRYFQGAVPFIDPATTSGTDTTRPFGVIVRASASTAADTYIYGSWAVTAP